MLPRKLPCLRKKKIPNGINRRLEIARVKTSEYQDTAIETIQNEKHKVKRFRRKKKKKEKNEKKRKKKKMKEGRKEH